MANGRIDLVLCAVKYRRWPLFAKSIYTLRYTRTRYLTYVHLHTYTRTHATPTSAPLPLSHICARTYTHICTTTHAPRVPDPFRFSSLLLFSLKLKCRLKGFFNLVSQSIALRRFVHKRIKFHRAMVGRKHEFNEFAQIIKNGRSRGLFIIERTKTYI